MINFEESAWDDYLYWQKLDRNKLVRINSLINECARTPFAGIGKPEPLRGNLAGYWSRRIDEEHRLVYSYKDKCLTIISCRYHY